MNDITICLCDNLQLCVGSAVKKLSCKAASGPNKVQAFTRQLQQLKREVYVAAILLSLPALTVSKYTDMIPVQNKNLNFWIVIAI
jgi:hypothetical protein